MNSQNGHGPVATLVATVPEAGNEPLVIVDAVSKYFPRVVALESVSLRVHPGERVALMGPSGSGKSTLLNLLSGMAQPDTGSVSVAGRSLAQKLPRRELSSLVGSIHQQLDLVPQLPALHNVLAGRFGRWGVFRSFLSMVWPQDYHLGMSALQQMGIADRAQERTSHLSGGEQQRVAIARTMVQSPLLVLADEPVSSVDPRLAQEILELLVQLTQDSDRILIASMHTPYLVQQYFTRAVGLREGRIQFDLPVAELTPTIQTDLYALGQERVGSGVG